MSYSIVTMRVRKGEYMKAIVLNCTLKASPEVSNTELLANVMIESLEALGCKVTMYRIAEMNIPPGVSSEAISEEDEWPELHDEILDSEILVMASPTWLGHPSSVAQKVLERLDRMISETDDSDLPVAYNKVAGVVVTGNEDGAHHVISEICGALNDIGFTTPGQAWTYWNKGPGPGPSYSETNEGHEWSTKTAEAAARNLVAVATALQKHPISNT